MAKEVSGQSSLLAETEEYTRESQPKNSTL